MQVLPDGAMGDAKDAGDLAHRVSGVAEDNCCLAPDGEWRYRAREGTGLVQQYARPCCSPRVAVLFSHAAFPVPGSATGSRWDWTNTAAILST